MATAPDEPLAYANTAGAPYSCAPHSTRSNTSWWHLSDEVTIGADVEPRESLRHIASAGGIEYYLGASRNGIGVVRLENYGRT